MHILLVRHGESSNNQIEAELGECHSYYQRRAVDPGLSALGEEQARTHPTRIAVTQLGCIGPLPDSGCESSEHYQC